MTKQNKLDLLTRLVKEGHITLSEAFDLLEPTKDYVVQTPNIQWIPSPSTTIPYIPPYTITM
jgi:hypothetical protein